MSRTHDMTHLINDPFHDGVRSRFTPTERSGGSPDGTAVGLPIVLTPYRPIGFTLIPAMVQGKITCSSQIGILFDYRTTRPKARGESARAVIVITVSNRMAAHVPGGRHTRHRRLDVIKSTVI